MLHKIHGSSTPKLIVLILIFYSMCYKPEAAANDRSQINTNDRKAVKLSLLPIQEVYCTKEAVEVKVVFQNTSEKDLIMIDPTTCESCLFFEIKNAKGESVKPEYVGEVIYQVHEPHLKLVLLKAKDTIESKRDVTNQYFGLNKYSLTEGKYLVSAKFRAPYKVVAKDGKRAYDEEIESLPIAVSVVATCSK